MRHVVALMREVDRLRELRLRVDQRARDVEQALEGLARLGMLAQTAEPRAVLMGVRTAMARDGADLAELVEGLDDAIKEVCTLPVRTLLEPLERAVRDVCRARGKEASLDLVGGELSLDRRVLEALRGALVHLVRNAVDHGIEMPEVRRAAGKAPEGTVVVRVEQQGNIAFLEVADDGGGLDAARIRETAERHSVLHPRRARSHGPGRGDAARVQGGVHDRRERHGDLGARRGARRGAQPRSRRCTARSTCRASPARAPASWSPCRRTSAPRPCSSSGRAAACSASPCWRSRGWCGRGSDRLHLARGQARFEHEDRILPLFDLGALAGLRQALTPSEGQPLLVVHVRGERAAILVDDILHDLELAVQPLPPELSGIAAYQGAASLADGEFVMVLRPEWLVRAERRAEEVAASAKRALVIDDSLTARAMHRAILESGGFTVHALASAADAMARLCQTSYAVVVCDVAMGGMDGLAFTRLVRGHPDTRGVPVVLVSARDDEANRSAGIAAGADAYVSKKDCAAGLLLSEVSAAMARRSAR